MVNAPHIALKVIVVAHFVLTVWASMIEGFLPPAYIYMSAFVLTFGVWAIISQDSVDAIFMFMVLNVISILLDIIFLSVKAPAAQSAYENPASPAYVHRDQYRFCLGMAILNLLIKPFSSFILFRLYQDRGGQYSDFTIPGMPNFGQGGRGGNYENIDQPVPSNTVETAGPHHSVDSPALTP